MTHFNISLAVKLPIDNNKQKKRTSMYKCEYYLNGGHYTVEYYDMIKYC